MKFLALFVCTINKIPAIFQTWGLARSQNSRMLIAFFRCEGAFAEERAIHILARAAPKRSNLLWLARSEHAHSLYLVSSLDSLCLYLTPECLGTGQGLTNYEFRQPTLMRYRFHGSLQAREINQNKTKTVQYSDHFHVLPSYKFFVVLQPESERNVMQKIRHGTWEKMGNNGETFLL